MDIGFQDDLQSIIDRSTSELTVIFPNLSQATISSTARRFNGDLEQSINELVTLGDAEDSRAQLDEEDFVLVPHESCDQLPDFQHPPSDARYQVVSPCDDDGHPDDEQDEYAEMVDQLASMFPDVSDPTIRSVLMTSGADLEGAVMLLLEGHRDPPEQEEPQIVTQPLVENVRDCDDGVLADDERNRLPLDGYVDALLAVLPDTPKSLARYAVALHPDDTSMAVQFVLDHPPSVTPNRDFLLPEELNPDQDVERGPPNLQPSESLPFKKQYSDFSPEDEDTALLLYQSAQSTTTFPSQFYQQRQQQQQQQKQQQEQQQQRVAVLGPPPTLLHNSTAFQSSFPDPIHLDTQPPPSLPSSCSVPLSSHALDAGQPPPYPIPPASFLPSPYPSQPIAPYMYQQPTVPPQDPPSSLPYPTYPHDGSIELHPQPEVVAAQSLGGDIEGPSITTGTPTNLDRAYEGQFVATTDNLLQESQGKKVAVDDTEKLIQQILQEEERLEKERYALSVRRNSSQHSQEREKENEAALQRMLETERQERQKELDSRTYECLICEMDYPLDEMYTIDECYHRFCFECMEGYLRSKIMDGATRDILCPGLECNHILSCLEIKHCIDERLYEKYDHFLLTSALNSDPACRWCPKPGCGCAMLGQSDQPMLVCPNEKCNFSFCFNCREEWHADASCDQYQQWKIENGQAEERFSNWAGQNTKGCPNCKSPIEKNGGCNHMTCIHCKHEFCWLCMQPYERGHFSKTDCKQFS